MPDALVTSAIHHWAPRLVANGVALTDFEEVTASLTSWNDWCAAWSACATIHEQMGRDALGRGKMLSAGEHLQRAGVYYHFAKFLFVHDVAQMKAAHAKAIECRKLAAPHLAPPGERVAIPFEGKTLYGILRKPAGVAKPPVMVMVCGLDSCKEETDAYEAPFLARGIATLVFDGPGQGEAEYDFPIRGNYETAVAAVVDYVMTRLGSYEIPIVPSVPKSHKGGWYQPRWLWIHHDQQNSCPMIPVTEFQLDQNILVQRPILLRKKFYAP